MLTGLANSVKDGRPAILLGLKPDDVVDISGGKIMHYQLSDLNQYREEGEPELPEYEILIFVAAGDNLRDLEIDMLETKLKKSDD